MHPTRWLAPALLLTLMACRPAPPPEIGYDPASLRLSGDSAYATLSEFVERFPRRHSGAPNNARAVAWLSAQFEAAGWSCSVDAWTVVNYSRPVDLRNLVCLLPGRSDRQVLVVAHHDQSPRTIQGADNDGSGIAILAELGRIFGAEPEPPHTLVFVSTDAEEYGMLGTRRFLEVHPRPDRILAGLSLDNLGKRWSNGMDMSPIGQFRGYGPLWLQQLARDAAAREEELWVPRIRGPVDQVLGQAVPISFMDQGPMVAAGVPALGFATLYAPGTRDSVWATYHSLRDSITYESAEVLGQSGRIAEATIRALLALDEAPAESGPYLYFEESERVLRGLPLSLLFLGVVALFLVVPVRAERSGSLSGAARRALPRFLALWLPLVGGVLLLYALVAAGLMDRWALYPATPRDPAIFHPRWPAVAIFLAGVAGLFALGQRVLRRRAVDSDPPGRDDVRILAFGVTGISAAYVLAINPFSLLFFLPLLAWHAIRDRTGLGGRTLDLALFAAGGLLVYVLIYFFGFLILRNDWAILWYLMMMFSAGMIGFPTALAITAVLAAGLSLVVPIREEGPDERVAPAASLLRSPQAA